eukprot:200604_1
MTKIKEELEDLRSKRNEAIKSKIRLLQTSSLEIERLRDEIKLLTGARKPSLREVEPNRYHSAAYHMIRNGGNRGYGPRDSIRSYASYGSHIPLDHAAHQQLLSSNVDDNENSTYLGSAWTYTLGMLSSVGGLFGGGGDTTDDGNDTGDDTVDDNDYKDEENDDE